MSENIQTSNVVQNGKERDGSSVAIIETSIVEPSCLALAIIDETAERKIIECDSALIAAERPSSFVGEQTQPIKVIQGGADPSQATVAFLRKTSSQKVVAQVLMKQRQVQTQSGPKAEFSREKNAGLAPSLRKENARFDERRERREESTVQRKRDEVRELYIPNRSRLDPFDYERFAHELTETVREFQLQKRDYAVHLAGLGVATLPQRVPKREIDAINTQIGELTSVLDVFKLRFGEKYAVFNHRLPKTVEKVSRPPRREIRSKKVEELRAIHSRPYPAVTEPPFRRVPDTPPAVEPKKLRGDPELVQRLAKTEEAPLTERFKDKSAVTQPIKLEQYVQTDIVSESVPHTERFRERSVEERPSATTNLAQERNLLKVQKMNAAAAFVSQDSERSIMRICSSESSSFDDTSLPTAVREKLIELLSKTSPRLSMSSSIVVETVLPPPAPVANHFLKEIEQIREEMRNRVIVSESAKEVFAVEAGDLTRSLITHYKEHLFYEEDVSFHPSSVTSPIIGYSDIEELQHSSSTQRNIHEAKEIFGFE